MIENIVERLVHMSATLEIDLDDLPDEILVRSNEVKLEEKVKKSKLMGSTLQSKEREFIISILLQNKGNIRKSAEELDVSRDCLYGKLKKWKIDLLEYRK